MSRKSNGGQLIRYVFKYVNKQGKQVSQVKEKERRTDKLSKGLPKDIKTITEKALQLKSELREEKQEEAQLVLTHNIRSRSVDGYIKEFKENEENRIYKRKDMVSLHHTILSFSNKDKQHITSALLKDISKQYVELRGRNNLYVFTSHHDKEHIHIHCCTSGTQLNGKASRISRKEFGDIKQALQEYQMQKYPALVHSLPRHGKAKNKEISKEAILKNINSERFSHKQSLLRCLETAYTKAKSTEQFLARIKAEGHEPYFRNGRLQGVKYEGGQKFRFSNLKFDLQKLQELDIRKAKEEKVLSELKALRESKGSEIGRTVNHKEVSPTSSNSKDDIKNEKDVDTLQELEDIRTDADRDADISDITNDDDRDSQADTDETDDVDNSKSETDSETDDSDAAEDV